ncbi:MAG: HXXEE domain-containing protein [Janthinobacterium lividum]
MNFWRKHWFDVGAGLALLLGGWLYLHRASLSPAQLLLGVSFVTLLLHQVEEYRWPGYFPGMLNAAVYRSATPERYPLNTQTALIINALLGWVVYALAALFARQLPWLGIATVLISLGNVLAHTFLFNLKGKTWYNPGLATALLLFLPLAMRYGHLLLTQHLAAPHDWLTGVPLGVALNYFCIVKPIDWLADPATPFHFENRQLRPADRKPE